MGKSIMKLLGDGGCIMHLYLGETEGTFAGEHLAKNA